MLKQKKSQLYNVSELEDSTATVVKAMSLHSIDIATKATPIGKLLSQKHIINIIILSIVMCAIVGTFCYIVAQIWPYSGAGYKGGAVLFVILILLSLYVLYRAWSSFWYRVRYTLRINRLGGMRDCTQAVIVNKQENVYIEAQNGINTPYADYYCEYVFFDGKVVRSGVFRGNDAKATVDAYIVGSEVMVAFDTNDSVAIYKCDTVPYRYIGYKATEQRATEFASRLPVPPTPANLKKTESSTRAILRVLGFLTFGIPITMLAVYMWSKLQVSANMVFTIHALSVVFGIIGVLFLILGVATIVRLVLEYLEYRRLVKNCEFAYGVMYDDGGKTKRRGYSFVYYDSNHKPNVHIASSSISRNVQLFGDADKPTILLLAYNYNSIDIIQKLDYGRAEYPTLSDVDVETDNV